MPAAKDARVLVCGMGHVGYRVARLLRRLGTTVVVIGENLKAEWARTLTSGGASVVAGDPTDDGILEQARLDETTALIGATDSDLTNLEIALDARRLRPEPGTLARTHAR
jgi:Trk K+ transport system NAD-binding subunit